MRSPYNQLIAVTVVSVGAAALLYFGRCASPARTDHADSNSRTTRGE
jgi:hypothetical protein